MFFLLLGPDSFSRAEARTELCRSLDADGMLATNTTVFDGKSLGPDQLMATTDAAPFLSLARLVLVEGLLAAQEGKVRRGRSSRASAGAKEESAPWSAFVEYLPRMPESTTLVLDDGEIRADNWLLAAVRPYATERQFPLLQPDAAQRWVIQRARMRQTAITPRAAATLAEAIGPNLWQLASEVEKLSLYAHGRPIDVADVTAMVSVAQTGTVFQLCDAIVAGRGEDALRLVRVLMSAGAAGPYLLTMIARQVRQLLIARDLQQHRASRAEIARRAEAPEFRVMNVIGLAQRFATGKLEAIYERLLEADLAIKRGTQDEDTALELLVAEIAEMR